MYPRKEILRLASVKSKFKPSSQIKIVKVHLKQTLDESYSHLSLIEGVLGGDPGALGVRSLGGDDGQESGEDKHVAIHGTCRLVVGRAIGVQGLLYRPAPRAEHLLTLTLEESKRERCLLLRRVHPGAGQK